MPPAPPLRALPALFLLPQRTYADSAPQPAPLSFVRRERAARALTIATALEPYATRHALRLARARLRSQPPLALTPTERTFLHHTLREGIARGVACAVGGAAASYAILKFVLMVIPLTPSIIVTRAAMSAVSFGAVVAELASVPDITTIELLLMEDSALGGLARQSMEEYNPSLLLLQTLDRQQPVDAGGGRPGRGRNVKLHSGVECMDVTGAVRYVETPGAKAYADVLNTRSCMDAPGVSPDLADREAHVR